MSEGDSKFRVLISKEFVVHALNTAGAAGALNRLGHEQLLSTSLADNR
jgi:hypothetical protein